MQSKVFPDKYLKMKAILGKKILMTRIFDAAGVQIPVTLVKLENNLVIGSRTKEKNGYTGLQIGVGNKKKLNKPQKGQIKDIKDDNFRPRKVYEIKTEKIKKIGETIGMEEFKEGEKINITGLSKGKGFAGTVKRHHFNTGPKTHGSNNYRQPGSIGATDAARVFKGRRMAGHLGSNQSTLKNLQIVKINQETKEILIKGALPGIRGSDVLIWSRNET